MASKRAAAIRQHRNQQDMLARLDAIEQNQALIMQKLGIEVPADSEEAPTEDAIEVPAEDAIEEPQSVETVAEDAIEAPQSAGEPKKAKKK